MAPGPLVGPRGSCGAAPSPSPCRRHWRLRFTAGMSWRAGDTPRRDICRRDSWSTAAVGPQAIAGPPVAERRCGARSEGAEGAEGRGAARGLEGVAWGWGKGGDGGGVKGF